MRKNFNKILKGISVDDVQIDHYDNDAPIIAEKTKVVEPIEKEQLEVANTKNTIPKVAMNKRGRKKKEAVSTKVSGRRFRGKDYTSTRIRKDLIALLRLLFEEMTSVEIMEFLAVQYLEQNQKLLVQKVAVAKR